MTSIRVELHVPTEAGRLFPRYAEEADFLEIQSSVARPWPYGVNVDGGAIVFDLDGERVLTNVDILIPRRHWKFVERLPAPRPTIAADIVFDQETIDLQGVSCEIQVLTDPERSVALIVLGRSTCQTEAIELSERCTALVHTNQLVGFYVVVRA